MKLSPSADTIGPRQGIAPLRNTRPDHLARGPVGNTGIVVRQWVPGRLLVLRQSWSWRPSALLFVLAIATALFVVVPTIEAGEISIETLRADLPSRTWLTFGSVVLALAILAALPRPGRTATFEFLEDALRIRRPFRRSLVLGISRARGLFPEENVAMKYGEHTRAASPTSLDLSITIWIEPESGDPMPFTLIAADTVRRSDRFGETSEAIYALTAQLAAILGIPASPPDGLPQQKPFG